MPDTPAERPPAVREAWDEYLEATRDQDDARYLEVEPWAWNRLQRRLKVLRPHPAKAA